MRLRTHTIQLRSITSPTSPKAHGSDAPALFSCVRTARKYSRNHFVTKSRRRLSFSVIFGRSDLISLSRDARNAASCQLCDDKGHKVCAWGRGRGLRTIKTRFDERVSKSTQRRPRFGRQVIVARNFILLLALLFILTLDKIDHRARLFAQSLLSMQDEWLGGRGGRIGRNRGPCVTFGRRSRGSRNLFRV
jgi:hypothetical protein